LKATDAFATTDTEDIVAILSACSVMTDHLSSDHRKKNNYAYIVLLIISHSLRFNHMLKKDNSR